jgi:hypothetical protein
MMLRMHIKNRSAMCALRLYHTRAMIRSNEPTIKKPTDVARTTAADQVTEAVHNTQKPKPPQMKDVRLWLTGAGLFITFGMWYIFLHKRGTIIKD